MKRLTTGLMVAALLWVPCSFASAQPQPDRYYQIKNVNSGLVLAIGGGSKADEAKVIQAKAGTDNTQQWRFVKVGDCYKIVNRKSGKVLDVYDSSKEKGVQIQQFKYNGGRNQQWSVVKKGKHFAIKARHSGMVIDIVRGSDKAGTPLIQWPEHDKGNQLFDLVPLGVAAQIQVVHRVPLPRGRTAVYAEVAPDGSRFGVGLDGSNIATYDGKTGFPAYLLPGYGPVFTAKGTFVAAYSGPTLRVFDPVKGKELKKTDFGADIHGMLRLPDDTRLVVWTADGKAHVYAVGTGKVAHSWPFHADSFFAWPPSGNVLFLRSQQGGPYRALDVQSGQPVAGFEKIVSSKRIYSILSGGEEAIVDDHLVNIKTGKSVLTVPDNRKGRPAVVAGGRGHTDRSFAVDGDTQGRLRLLDVLAGGEVAALTLPDGEKSLRDHTIGLSPDGQFGCVATDRSVYLLRLTLPNK
jgi:hypothetical protein